MVSAGPLHPGRLTWNTPQTCELWCLFNSQLPSVLSWVILSTAGAHSQCHKRLTFALAASCSAKYSKGPDAVLWPAHFSPGPFPTDPRQFSPSGLPSLSSLLCLDSACLCCVQKGSQAEILALPCSLCLGDYSPAVSCTNSGPSYFVYFASIIVVYRVVYLGPSYPITARGERGQCFHPWANWWDEVLAKRSEDGAKTLAYLYLQEPQWED